MGRHLRQHLRQAFNTVVCLLVVLSGLPIVQRPAAALASVTQGGGFGSAVGCLNRPDQFATTRFGNTIFGAGASPASAAAVQIVGASGVIETLATVAQVGAVYGLAYDDGAVSGAERIFAAAYTKRLSGYAAEGNDALYVFTRTPYGWSAPTALEIPGVVAHSRPAPSADPLDIGATSLVGKRSIGDMEVSPDGRELYLVNIAARRLEVFNLTGSALPAHARSVPINQGVISADPAVQADLWPFALEFFPYPLGVDRNQMLLMVGVTDSAQRGVVGGQPRMSGSLFQTPPRAHLLAYNLATGSWALSLSQDLGNSAALATRHVGSAYGDGVERVSQSFYPVRSWNPWQDNPSTMPAEREVVYYPQPLLSDIEFVRDSAPTSTPAFGSSPTPWPLMVLGVRDRLGDQVFNGAAAVPSGANAAFAQGDTLVYRYAGGWQLQGGEFFDDSSHAYGGPTPLHIENHMGALASVPSPNMTLASPAETLATTTLAGNSRQALRIFGGKGRTGGGGSDALIIATGDHAATKASNLGDMELLCSYALVGGRVWDDFNYDGIQNDGPNSAMAGVTLDLILDSALPKSAPAIASATTDANGAYLFAVPPNSNFSIRLSRASRSNLQLGLYSIVKPNQTVDNLDSDISAVYGTIEFARNGAGFTGMAIAAPLRESDERRFDIGLMKVEPPGIIGDFVWVDANGDGIQNSGEQGLTTPVPVTLEVGETAALVPDNRTYTRLSGSNGRYGFSQVPAGVYRLRFGLPAGHAATARDRGGDDARDSDADAASGYATDWFTFGDAIVDTTHDFGVRASVNLALSKSGPATATAGYQLSYSITYRNQGGPATNVQIVDELPAGVSFAWASPPPTAVSGRRLRWDLGTLPAYASGTITVYTRAATNFSPPGDTTPTASSPTTLPVTNCATISADGGAPVTSTPCAQTILQRPELTIAKTASIDPVPLGAEFSYTLTATNVGAASVSGLEFHDRLPAGLTFVRFTARPMPCSYYTNSRTIYCFNFTLAPGASTAVSFLVRADAATAGHSIANTGVIRLLSPPAPPGDDPANNSATNTVLVAAPDPGVTIAILPDQPASLGTTPPVPGFPVGTPGRIRVAYGNGLAPSQPGVVRGPAENAALSIALPAGLGGLLGAVPAGCTRAIDLVTCALGTLAADARGSLDLPLALPPDFPADRLTATATISSTSAERPADGADNSASAAIDVVRPNVFVDAGGPASIVGQGSVFWYTLDYGNLHRRAPALTRAAEGVLLRATLPQDVTFVQASLAPSSVDGQELTWELGTLDPREVGAITVVVQTDVPAGATLRLDAAIATDTPGDDPADNADTVLTDVVQPPALTQARSAMRLAIHSELDPRSADANPANAVYLSEGATIAWPAGEVLDFTPRLGALSFENDPLPFPYEYRARVVGWSVAGFGANGAMRDPLAPDARGRAGCRPGLAPSVAPTMLPGCAYGYLGGADRDAIASPPPLQEQQLRTQAHVYWSQPPAPPMRDDVYLYTLDPIEAAAIDVAVEVEVWIVNAYPGAIDGIPLPEIPVAPLPDPARQLITQRFDVQLLVPRTVVGPGSLGD